MKATYDTSRYSLLDTQPESGQIQLKKAVEEGFQENPKRIPPQFFYDERGSKLFEEITKTTEYYLTDSEINILSNHADKMVEAIGSDVVLTELGAGNCAKSTYFIEAILSHQKQLLFEPIDVSKDQLESSAIDLISTYENLTVNAICATYEKGLQQLPQVDESRLFLFLGSSIGNFPRSDVPELLQLFSTPMTTGDFLLIGVDLVKDPAIIENAYNDSEGITAEFNKNLLHRINRELGGDFDATKFKHHAPFIENLSRVEMRLVSKQDQTIPINKLNSTYQFNEGEYIHTENSYKYSIDEFVDLVQKTDLEVVAHWTDNDDYFAEILLSKP